MAKQADINVIARRYSTALFDLAGEKKKLDIVADDLSALDALLDESGDVQRLFNDPTISASVRLGALEAISNKAKLSPLTVQFLQTLADNGRLDAFVPIARAFQHLLIAQNDELLAEVTSSVELKKAQQTELQKMLKNHFGKQVALQCVVDAAMLGGVKVKVAGQLIDATIQGRLQRLKTHLNAGVQQMVAEQQS